MLSDRTATVDTNSPRNIPYSTFFYVPKKRLDRWHVCENFQNGICENSESECELAHPTPGKEVKDGIVTVCMDHVNEQCKRQSCKYLHPPKHICDQIHDHKKKPHPGMRSRSLSNSSDKEIPDRANSTSEDFYPPQYQIPYPFNMYYPNSHPNTVFYPPFARPPYDISGQGMGSSFPYQNPEFQLPPGLQDSRGQKPRAKPRSTSFSAVPTVHSPLLPSYHNQLSAPAKYRPSPLHIKFPSSTSSIPSSSANTLQANLIGISVDDDSTDTPITNVVDSPELSIAHD